MENEQKKKKKLSERTNVEKRLKGSRGKAESEEEEMCEREIKDTRAANVNGRLCLHTHDSLIVGCARRMTIT